MSPEGVSAGSTSMSVQWFRRSTGPDGTAAAVNTIFRDGSFPSFGIFGSLRDQIAILSKVLSVLYLEHGHKEDLYELRKRLKTVLEDPRRPLMFQKMLSPNRIQAIMNMLSILDLSNTNYSDNLLIDTMLAAKNRPVEEALVERTLLLAVIQLMGREEKLLRLFLRFHYAHFISTYDKKDIKTHLCPDTAKLLANIAMLSCHSSKPIHKKTMQWYFEDLLIGKSERYDLIKAIAYEIDGEWGEKGKNCMKSLLKEGPINYDRQNAFPTVEPVPSGRLMLRHSPDFSPYSALFKLTATSKDARIEAKPVAQQLDSSLDGMQVDLSITKNSVKIEPVNSRFLVVRLRTYRLQTETQDTTTHQDTAEEEPSHSEHSNEYDQALSSIDSTSYSEGSVDKPQEEISMKPVNEQTREPETSVREESVDNHRSLSEDQSSLVDSSAGSEAIFNSDSAKVLDIADNIEYETFICTFASPCTSIPVLPDDIILMIHHPTATKLTVKERDALVWAWYGSGREKLLQIAASFPSTQLYHAALVERQ